MLGNLLPHRSALELGRFRAKVRRFFERLAPFLDGKVNQADGAEAVGIAESGELIQQTGRQQNERHINADLGAIRIGQDGRRIEPLPDSVFGVEIKAMTTPLTVVSGLCPI